jgi:hypothetical protein
MRKLIALAALFLLAACARPPLETEADQAARNFMIAVRLGDWTAVDAALAPEAAAAPDRRERFEAARRAIPGGAVDRALSVGWIRTEQDGHKRITAVHLYRFPGVDLAVSTTLERVPPANTYRVVGFSMNRLAPGVLERSRFSLAGKTPRQLAFLASAVLSPLAMAGVALTVIFTPGLRWKPLWFALCFVGVGSAWMNWTSGQGGFVWSQVGLVDFGVSRATDISPWIIRFAAPVGALASLAALLFLRRQPAKA